LVRALAYTHSIAEQYSPNALKTNPKTRNEEQAIFDSSSLCELPDAAVLFRRYLDSGRVINAYDWFESFRQAMTSEREIQRSKNGSSNGIEVVEQDSSSDGDGDRDEAKWQKEIQARFLRGLHELDWNGLLRPTTRKRDHVARTLFDPPPTSN